MKNALTTALILLVVMLSFPITALPKKSDIPAVGASAALFDIKDSSKNTAEFFDTFRIKDLDSGEITSVSADDYIRGVVAAEMPALYDEEALKAQAVAAYTYACRKKQTTAHQEYDLTDDPAYDQCYINEQEAYGKWGENAEKYLQKIKSAVEAVSGQMLTYDGNAAMTVYHAISSGSTNDCKDVWGSDIPYLISVDSPGDTTSNGYLSTVSFTPDEIRNSLSSLVRLSGNEENWFSTLTTANSGLVKNITVCGTNLTGAEVSNALELRSSAFEVNFTDGNFVFTVKGYGHGVGMSQTGAGHMAQQGSSYKEILEHYYPGCILTEK